MGEEPEEDGEGGAEKEAGDDREVEGGVFAAMDDVAGEAAEAYWKFSAEVEKSAEEGEECAENEERAAEFAERIHEKIVEEMKERSNEVRKQKQGGREAQRLECALKPQGDRRQQKAHSLKSVPPRPSDQFEGRKEIADFEGGGFRGVRAVGAIVADAGAEVAANGAGSGFLGVGGAHGVAPFSDGVFGFEDEGEDFAGAHELGEFAEERALAMHRVEAAGFVFGEAHGLDGDDFEAGLVDARKNFTLLAVTHSVRLY